MKASRLLPFLPLTVLLCLAHPAHAQQWRTSLTQCDQNGNPLAGLDQDGNPYNGCMTDGTITLQNGGDQNVAGAGDALPPVFDPLPGGGVRLYSWSDDGTQNLYVGAEAGSLLYYGWSDAPDYVTSFGASSARFSFASHFHWQALWDDGGTGLPPNPTTKPTPPAQERFLLRTEMKARAFAGYGNNGYGPGLPWDYRGLTASTSVQDDAFAESVGATAPAVPVPLSGQAVSQSGGGRHLVSAGPQTVNGCVLYTVTLTGSGQGSTVAKVPDWGINGYCKAGSTLTGYVSPDTRAVSAIPAGHEPTFKKEGYLTDTNGNQILDNYGYPMGKAVENTPSGDALQVDIGVPARNYTYDTVSPFGYAQPPDTSGSVYDIDYDGTVHGGPNYPNWADNGTDAYTWYSSHTGHSDGDTLPHVIGLGDYSIYPFPVTYQAPYVMQTLYADPSNSTVELNKQDADGSQIDHINFHYHFSKDSADATYNLYLHLHLIHENWTLENTYTELPSNTLNAPAAQLQCDPSPQTGGHPTVYTRSPLPRSLQYSADGASLAVAVEGQLLDPEVNAFLAATGIGIQKIVPQPTTESFPDTIADWQAAKTGVSNYNHPELMQPPSLAQTDPENDAAVQASCTYELWERVYNKQYVWVGDKYGDNGYIGPDTWFDIEPYSRPIEHRYTLVNIVPTSPGP